MSNLVGKPEFFSTSYESLEPNLTEDKTFKENLIGVRFFQKPKADIMRRKFIHPVYL